MPHIFTNNSLFWTFTSYYDELTIKTKALTTDVWNSDMGLELDPTMHAVLQ